QDENPATAETVRCVRCGRTLTAAASIARGYGPGCAARIRQAAPDLSGYTGRQADQARELIADGALVHLRSSVFVAVSTDGAETYLSAPTSCTCPAGLRAKACYHTAAARIMLAASGSVPVRAVRPARTFALAA